MKNGSVSQVTSDQVVIVGKMGDHSKDREVLGESARELTVMSQFCPLVSSAVFLGAVLLLTNIPQ